jgi:hypothetical protein
MPALSPPYAATTDVALFLQSHLRNATDFHEGSTPTKDTVTNLLSLVSGHIDMQLRMAGYAIPLEAMSGESWPSTQTTWLKLVTCFGTLGFIGFAIQPLPPAPSDNRRGTGNLYQDMYMAEMAKIYTPIDAWNNRGVSHIALRADYLPGSAAERALLAPRGPSTDFMEGKQDPLSTLTVWEIADSIMYMQDWLRRNRLYYDYMWGLFDVEKGIGQF